MIQIDLEKALDTMSKEGILAQLSVQIDVAIAKKIEAEHKREEEKKKRYAKAQERVSLGTYTTEDLEVLEEALKNRSKSKVASKVAPALSDKAAETSFISFDAADKIKKYQAASQPSTPTLKVSKDFTRPKTASGAIEIPMAASQSPRDLVMEDVFRKLGLLD